MKKFLIWWWPTILIVLVILWLTLAPQPLPENDIELFPGADKIVHALMMGGLTAVALYDFSRSGEWRIGKVRHHIIIWVGIAAIVFSAIDEWAQGAMGLGRSSDYNDLIADTIGIITVCVIALLTIKK